MDLSALARGAGTDDGTGAAFPQRGRRSAGRHEEAPPRSLQERALKQAARELLLAQASDWPFILRTGTSPGYARQRVKEHLLRFTRLYEQLTAAQLDAEWLKQIEWRDNIFPDVDCRYWA